MTSKIVLERLLGALAVVVKEQAVTATTRDRATTLVRNCQLPEGERVFIQRERAVHVVSKELRDTFKKQKVGEMQSFRVSVLENGVLV